MEEEMENLVVEKAQSDESMLQAFAKLFDVAFEQDTSSLINADSTVNFNNNVPTNLH